MYLFSSLETFHGVTKANSIKFSQLSVQWRLTPTPQRQATFHRQGTVQPPTRLFSRQNAATARSGVPRTPYFWPADYPLSFINLLVSLTALKKELHLRLHFHYSKSNKSELARGRDTQCKAWEDPQNITSTLQPQKWDSSSLWPCDVYSISD